MLINLNSGELAAFNEVFSAFLDPAIRAIESKPARIRRTKACRDALELYFGAYLLALNQESGRDVRDVLTLVDLAHRELSKLDICAIELLPPVLTPATSVQTTEQDKKEKNALVTVSGIRRFLHG